MTIRPSDRPDELGTADCVIASGASLSGAVETGGLHLVGIKMPATWTAANLTFQGSLDGVTFGDIYDASGNELEVGVASSRFVYIDPTIFAGLNYIRIRSGTAAVPVNQAAERTLELRLRAL